MQPEKLTRRFTVYLTEVEYQEIAEKARLFNQSSSDFIGEAMRIYLKHLQRYLEKDSNEALAA
jgi:hypothetical protein